MSLANPTPESENEGTTEASDVEPINDHLGPKIEGEAETIPEQSSAALGVEDSEALLEDGSIEPEGTPDEVVQTVSGGEVVSGRLTYENRIADVLRRLLKVKSKSDAILRLRSPSGTVDGSILITHRRFIAGAACEHGQVTGYAAVRKLLMLTAGDYRWSVPTPAEAVAIERNLNINLKALIPKLPFLPDTLNEFFDESSLLDKIFQPKKWAELIDDSAVLDWVFSQQMPSAVEPEDKIRAALPPPSRTWTAIEPISLVNEDRDQPIKVPRHLREGILRGESLAHTVTRNFGTVGSVAYANARRLQRKKTSFSASRAAGPLLSLPAFLLILAVVLVLTFVWMKKTSHNDVAVKKKSPSRSEKVLARHQKAH